uniref:WW domain-containing protein n=1 Tax=Grammatophora oceanica TaxID=210454 RepID=A0A7S1UTB5_9STRA
MEQLRQRGLARALNKHFTTVTKEIAKERAAADAAIKDLDQRRAKTRDFQPGQYEQTPWDTIRQELKQKKSEVRKKEKETLLLYQRYVNKFGDSGFVALPDMAKGYSGYLPSAQQSFRRNIPKGRTPVSSMATKIDQQLEENMKKGGDRLPSVEHFGWSETKQSATFKADKISRTTELRLLEARGVDAVAKSPASPSKSKRTTSATTTGSGGPMAPSLVETPISEKMAVVPGDAAADAQHPKTHISTTNNTEEDAPSIETAPTVTEPQGDFSDEDDRSVVSGLTSVNSQTIAAEADARLLEFLKSETEEIRKMMEAAASSSANSTAPDASSTTDLTDSRSVHTSGSTTAGDVRTSYSSEVGTQSVRAAEKAEDMVRKMQQMLTDFEQESQSVISGTSTSYTGNDEASSSAYPREFKTNHPNEKWMIYYDEQYKKEYYHEVHSGLTQWDKPKVRKKSSLYGSGADKADDFVPLADYASTKRKGKSRRSMQRGAMISHEDVRPEQKTTGVSRRDLYRRKKMKQRRRRRIIAAATLFVTLLTVGFVSYRYRTNPNFRNSVKSSFRPVTSTMDMAVGSTNSVIRSVVHATLPESTHSMLPEAWTGLQERRNAEEAKKRAEEEKRRLEEEQRRALEEEKKRLADEERRRKAKAAAEARAKKAKEAADLKARRAKEAAQLKAKKEREAAELKAQKEREAAEAKARKDQEAADLLAKKERLEAEERALRERLAAEERSRLEREAELLRIQQETELKLRQLETLRTSEIQAAAHAERLRRPFFCNIPLFYVVNGRCRRLSRENPLFDLEALSNALMQ